MNEDLKVKGHISIVVKDKDGNIKDTREIDNLVVTSGKTYLATWLAAATQASNFMSYVGLGTGTTPASASDTALQNPLASYVQGVLSSTSNSWINTCTFGAGVNTGAITEAGLFSSAVPGTMFAHQVFTVVTKGAADSMLVIWTVSFS